MVQRTLPATPIRTCIGCRQRGEASTLVRIVARSDGEHPVVVVDIRGTMPGRGAWLHPSEQCVALAVRRKAFGSALRVRGLTVHPEDLTEVVGADLSKQGQVAEDMSTP